MHPFLEYLLKANLLLVFFVLFYSILLKKETFYQLNRWYLIGSIIVSAIAPFISFTKTVWVDPIPVEYYVGDSTNVIINEVVEEPSFLEAIDLQQSAVFVLLFISVVLIFRKMFAIAKLYRSIKKLPNLGDSNIKINTNTETVYSFYKWIVVPENFFQWQNHQLILDHESIHLNQKHTFDLILVEMVAAVFWFNPLIKILQRHINSNLEFIVDAQMVQKTEPVLYQKNLLLFQAQKTIQFANSYSTSEIKSRILQLNSKKSTNMKKLKFLLATPALIAFFALFQVETVAQVKETIEVQEVSENNELEDSFYVMIHSAYNDAYYKRITKMLREKCNLNVTINNLKRNKDGELTSIKISCKDDNQYFLNEHKANTKPFSPFQLYVYRKGNGKYYIETVSGKDTKEKISSVPESDFLMLLDMVEKDLEVLKNNRKTFDKVASKFPIVVDGILMNKKQLKNFDTSKIKSIHIDAGNLEKGTIVNLSTNDDDNSGNRMFTFKIADDDNDLDYYFKDNNKQNLADSEKPFNKIIIDGKEATEEELQKLYRTAKNFQARNENKVIIVETNVSETNSDKPHTIVKIGNNTLKYIYLLNGKEITGEHFKQINPEDIDQITILKDQKSKEKYAATTKEAVMVITTKAKKKDSLKVSNRGGREFFEKLKKRAEELKAEQEQKRTNFSNANKQAQQKREALINRKKELLAERKQKLKERKKEIEKLKQIKKDLETVTSIFNDVKEIKKIEDEQFKITKISASITREDGTKVELSEDY